MNTMQYCPQIIQYMAQYTVPIELHCVNQTSFDWHSILCNSYTDRPGQGCRAFRTRKDFLGTRHSLPSQFTSISFALSPCLYSEGYACMYTYLTAYRLYMNYHCYHITLQRNSFYTNWERCEVFTGYLSLGAGLAVTGRIRDSRQSFECSHPVVFSYSDNYKIPFDIHGSVHRRWLSRNTNKMQLVIEFIIPKFIEGSTCFERHTAHHQEL